MNATELKPKLKELCKLLESEGLDPLRQLESFILSEDPTYLRVHTGFNKCLKWEIAKSDRHELLREILKMALED